MGIEVGSLRRADQIGQREAGLDGRCFPAGHARLRNGWFPTWPGGFSRLGSSAL